MIIRPRYAVVAGLLFVAVAVVYGLASRDYGGTTMLMALGIAIGLMAIVLARSPRGDEPDSDDAPR